MTEKQQQLTFEKGITNVPSDALCPDNTLEECVGMFYENGEHRVVQRPVEEIELPEGHFLLYVHEYGGFTRYITSYNGKLYWFYEEITAQSAHEIGTFTGNVSVESVGNTLILSDGSLLTYLLWDTKSGNPEYKKIGNSVPCPEIKFRIGDVGNDAVTYPDPHHDLTELLDGITVRKGFPDAPVSSVYGSKFKGQYYEDAKAGLIGLVSKRIKQVHEAKRFMFPFWIRYAVRLYDDSYIHISNPILLMPTVRHNWDIFTCNDDGDPKEMDSGGWPQTNYRPVSGKMTYVFTQGIGSEWNDIVSGVDIFVSEEVKTFDMEATWTIQNCFKSDDGGENYITNPLFENNYPLSDTAKDITTSTYNRTGIASPSSTDRDDCYTYFQPKELSDGEIIKKLIDASVFYRILEIDIENIRTNTVQDSTEYITSSTLENLTTQWQLRQDDYYSRAPMVASIMKSYNGRLHLADIERGFFDGFTHFSDTKYDEAAKNYKYIVWINTDSGIRIVSVTQNQTSEIADVWFYYPDPRAYRVMILNTTDQTVLLDSQLKTHPYLNGAYMLRKLPSVIGETRPTITYTDAPSDSNAPEIIKDRLFVSEVNNPFLFTSTGDVAVRMGDIKGIATQTMSLGEQEHGIHPLTVFSERGISLLKLADDGTYTRSDEISREVCNNAKSITETDGPVFFSSEKGLMVVLGNQVNCVSEQLSGKSDNPFQKYLRTAFLAYDYRDSLLWIFDGATHDNNVVGSRYCYLYSIKTGTFSRYDFGNNNIVSNVVSTYPDYLLQIGSNIYSLLHRANINDDDDDYSATFTTRPLKLENALALKSIMQIKHIKDMDGALTINIFASNNLKDWCELSSLRGTPWKYYKFQYNFSNMKATDRFAGSVLITQERRTDKLR